MTLLDVLQERFSTFKVEDDQEITGPSSPSFRNRKRLRTPACGIGLPLIWMTARRLFNIAIDIKMLVKKTST
ncbi:hypothetical protein [Rossellomorea sp. YZS02]|uniref:hypothetical protein n=1 Tax=Rossellomorea sp. YZS02 TaxID=3097358 RepID=UPI002A153128|nr:hypothetical protein [Rossellomorea sp. YZS02]MDX8342276.1 hypothetical protein [Rossellomorea sp. YZS02]